MSNNKNLETLYYPSNETPRPELNPEFLRIYGHELCPFAQRAFFAFGAKKIPFQKVHVDLQKKAQWHLNINEGLVPVLETTEGKTIHESGFLAQFASDYAPENQGLYLWPHEKEQKGNLKASLETANHRLLIQKFDKIMFGAFIGFYLNNFKNEEKNNNLVSALKEAEEFFIKNMNGTNWLSQADQPMYIDICAFTLIERVAMLKGSVWNQHYEWLKFEENFPTLFNYFKRFQSHELLKDHCITEKAYHAQIAMQNKNEPGTKTPLNIMVFDK